LRISGGLAAAAANREACATPPDQLTIRWAGNGAMLSVAYLWSEADPATTKIRLISARESTRTEIRQYQESP
jgi:uncharacterized DUF497 family protein